MSSNVKKTVPDKKFFFFSLFYKPMVGLYRGILFYYFGLTHFLFIQILPDTFSFLSISFFHFFQFCLTLFSISFSGLPPLPFFPLANPESPLKAYRKKKMVCLNYLISARRFQVIASFEFLFACKPTLKAPKSL